ncbi:MAG: hypothetical protein WA474_10450 [Candidatus Sulfotelmatobacter sp.]
MKPAIHRAYVKNSEKSNGNNDHKKGGDNHHCDHNGVNNDNNRD